ncbi:ATP-binding protein [Azotobacter beijerinckii]|uniref:ATP-binding protein n=1 Tax=Azotobacter beijerinckii TaxID=170623 RepID=UPI00295374FB|nr:ATP-binding protein [Azotobacter beijerinckii]MDV7212875.1 ATP-binding protein [Azotobacter beijerinckii]
MSRKKLPIGIQTFREIREEGYYYVDKTAAALELIDEGKYYFLSRPRRFGKSLFIDTLAELFEGNEPLFRGLAVHRQWDWSRVYPVIRISFGGGVIRDAADLQGKFSELLTINEQALGVTCTLTDHRARFAELIREAERNTGQRVVVLVDEYDKPILDNLQRPEIAREIRSGLRDFYSVIKDSDAHIRFAMLTGVSKFSKVSLFSGLNNLNDITLDGRYSSICGYTDEDVDTVFAPELPGLDRNEIRTWYNGYNWTGTSVYNPFDLLLLFAKREFHPYWFETGTPTFLIEQLLARRVFTPDLSQVVAMETLLSSFDIDCMPVEALMFQTGYLTIDSLLRMGARTEYTLKYPNLEVQASLNGALLEGMTGDPLLPGRQTGQLYRLLLANDFSGLQALFTAFFAGIPHDWYRNNPIAQYEGYYASVFYSHFAALGLDVRLEDATSHGRIDMAVLFNGQVYLFEFKVVELVPEGKALQQIRERGYAEKYRARGEPIHLIGVEFSRERRSVVGFEVEREG